jgi:hypothetical protein
MGAPSTGFLAATHELTAQRDRRCRGTELDSVALEAGPGENQQAAQLVLVHLQDRVQHLAVDRHDPA